MRNTIFLRYLKLQITSIIPLPAHHFFPATVAVHSRAFPHMRRRRKCLQPELRARIESMPPTIPLPSTPEFSILLQLIHFKIQCIFNEYTQIVSTVTTTDHECDKHSSRDACRQYEYTHDSCTRRSSLLCQWDTVCETTQDLKIYF